MHSGAANTTLTESRTKAWGRGIVATVSLVVLIQVFLIGAKMLLPGTPAPHILVVASVTSIALAELIVVAGLSWVLSREKRSFRNLGLWRRGATLAWIAGIGLGLLTALWGLSSPALHLPSKLGSLLDPSPWHIYSALVAGIVGGFCEEIIFRGFLMQELAAAGYAAWVQVVGSAFLFGLAHAGMLSSGWSAGLLVIIPTAMLGALYSLVYILGKRSLLPVIVSHFLNDFAVIPWVFLLAVGSRGH